MEPEDVEKILKKVVEDPQIIPGIHNYCDRWCERCTHTLHCSVFMMEKAMESDEEGTDDENKKFWNDVELMFKVAAKMMNEKMKELDIDPNDLPEEPITKSDPKSEKAVTLSREYTLKVADWIHANREKIQQKHELFISIGSENASRIADAFEIVQFYFMLISTKTYRCHLPSLDEDVHDALGSAKIAVIVIERSTASWIQIMEVFPEMEDEILGFLKDLATVKRLILKKWPKAMDFKRPGFDD